MSTVGIAYFCCSDARRAALARQPKVNGIDYVEVADLRPEELSEDERAEYGERPGRARAAMLWQRRLTLVFVNRLTTDHWKALGRTRRPDDAIWVRNLRISGGERPEAPPIELTLIRAPADERTLVLRCSARGDLSRYRLSVVTSAQDAAAPTVFDPLLAAVDFSFSVDCLSDFDCRVTPACPPPEAEGIEIDYLTRDYATFRQLILDRIAAVSPGWRERHAPDVGVALVELIAYAADYLSYRQEAVATEAYLGTSRRRVSVRRHVRLVDYPMHEGCNARAWIHLRVDETVGPAGVTLPLDDPTTGMRTTFLTRVPSAPTVLDAQRAAQAFAAERPETFELLLPSGRTTVPLYPQHNEIAFYTWGAAECCLPAGATRATLAGKLDRLQPGDLLLLEEVADPQLGDAGRADPTHRHVVRLTAVSIGVDPVVSRRERGRERQLDVTEVAWDTADALPFPLCLSANVSLGTGVTPTPIAVARGNIVLADHGRRVRPDEVLPTVPEPMYALVPIGERCAHEPAPPRPARFRPTLSQRELTHVAPPVDPTKPAAHAMRRQIIDVAPAIELVDGAGVTWTARRDLLASGPNAQDFVVECETDGTVELRFGDGVTHGQRPRAGTVFTAHYRVGNGSRGNVGGDAITHVVSSVASITAVRNPLAAKGGIDPESLEDVRRLAPAAFRTQERAVTAEDYADRAKRDPQLQDAQATFRWTGSWRTVFVTPDPLGGTIAPPGLRDDLVAYLEPYRMAGHDLSVDAPRYVPLEVAMSVCVKPEYRRSEVRLALQDTFSARALPDGRRGVFHPDNFKFGQTVYVSSLYAAALGVEGVASAQVTTFQRRGTPGSVGLQEGKLTFARLEIPRLDNDRSRPERGVFTLDLQGGT